MRLSRFLLKTTKPSGEAHSDISASQDFLVRSGMTQKVASGLFAWMPLGQRVLKKIEGIIHDEMTIAGACEVRLPVMQPASIWYDSGRLNKDESAYGPEMLRVIDRKGQELVVSPTCEELAATVMGSLSLSVRDLPVNIYQIQPKFRDEIRPRNGVMRAREFLMKDGYSFDSTPEAAELTYQKMFVAYQRIFQKIGVQALPLQADRGPVGGSMSHEFVIPSADGDEHVVYDLRLADSATIPGAHIYNDHASLTAYFKSIAAMPGKVLEKEDMKPLGDLQECRGIEVGHIFNLGTRYAESARAQFTQPGNLSVPFNMGCYGIGVSRLPAAIIESCHDKEGIIWPENVAPFHSVIVNLHPQDEAATALAEKLYQQFCAAGEDVLYDDRPQRPGVKLADMDLIGIPFQIRVGKKDAAEGNVELYLRQSRQAAKIASGDALKACHLL